MMNPRLMIAIAALVVAGCGAVARSGAPDPNARLRLGLTALANQDRSVAREHLEWVYRNHTAEPVGHQALLALIASELDPRNPARSLWASADLAAQLIHAPGAPEWTVPLGHTLYLVAIELGANEERITRAEEALDGVPELNRQSVPELLEEANRDRDSLRTQVTGLQQEVTQLRKELEEKTAELERIRKTVKG